MLFRSTRDASGAVLADERLGNEGDGAPHSAKINFKTPLGPGVLRANATYQAQNFKYEEHFRSAAETIDSVEKSTDPRLEIGLNYNVDLSDKLNLEVLGLQKSGTSDYRNTYDSSLTGFEVFTSSADIGESIVRGVLRYHASDALTVEGGGEAAFNFREGHVSYVANGTPIPLPSADVRVEEKRRSEEHTSELQSH